MPEKIPDELNDAQTAQMARLLASTPVVGELGQLFANAGHELYLVGGPVRDALLGVLQHDLDFTTSARPDDVEKLLRGWTKAVWDIGKDFGTIGAKKKSQGGEWQIEITTFRADIYRSDSRKPEVNFGDNIADDLIRRDFTVNAMAYDVAKNRFVDPYGGLADLASCVLRTPFTAERSFSDDPLRMMRAARFASQLQFTVAPDVQQAMTEMADRIEIISAERIRDELCKLLLTDHPRPGLNLLVNTSLADRVLPELSQLRQTQDEHKRHKDVYQHSLIVLDQAIELEKARGHQPDLVLRVASLLHDIGKPATRVFEEDGTVSFHHHDIVGAKLARKRLKALRFSSDDTKAICQLIEQHLRFHGYGEGQWSDSAVRRYVRDAGDQLERLHILTRSDCTTRNQRKAARLRAAYDDLEKRIGVLAEQEELDSMRPDLDGEQIMQILGLKPSREVGEAYKYLLNLRIDEGPLGEAQATQRLLQWWQQRPMQTAN